MPSVKAEVANIPIYRFESGQQPDFGETVSLPGWLKLSNLYYNSANEIRGRPHRVVQNSNSALNGLARSPKNTVLALADGNLYNGGSLVAAMGGSGDLVYAHMRDRTILAAGGNAYQLDEAGTTLSNLAHTNVYVVESGQGPFNDRVIYVSSTDKRQPYYSVWGLATDIGTLITATEANDEWTEGGYLNPVDYDIIDIHQFAGEWVIFTLQAIYRVTLNADEQGFNPRIIRQFDVNILDIRPWRFRTGILFWSDRGLMTYSIGENGPVIQDLNMTGVFRTITSQLVESEARLSSDESRSLFFIKPSNATTVTWVYNLRRDAWTEWDFQIEHAVNVGANAYVGKYADGDVYLLDDKDTGEAEPYDFTIQSGLYGFGDPILRKRWDTIGMSFHHTEILDLSIEVISEDIVSSYVPIKQTYQPEIARVEQKSNNSGRRGSILIIGTNRGEFTLPVNDEQNPPIYVKTYVKKPRIPKDQLNATA